MEIPTSLIDTTEKVGNDINLVQGPGGNISYKENGFMLIKASGTKMSDVKKKNIFVKTNHGKIISALKRKEKDPIKNSWEDINKIRPSIETSMHAIMPHKCVLHVHCVNTLSWIVQENYINKIKIFLKDENWISVPYKKPGISLSRSIENELHKNKFDVIFLSNHGLVVGADSPQKAYLITKRISERLFLGELEKNKVCKKNFDNFLFSNKYKLPKYEYVHRIAFSNIHTNMAIKGDLFPDQIVFLENGIVLVENVRELNNLVKLSDSELPVVLIPNIGILVPKVFKEVNEETLLGLSMIISRIPKSATLNYLSKINRDEIINWDLEKHRQKIND